MDEIKTSKESKEKDQEAFITGITIHKVRHLRNINIPLSKDERKHLILTGKNGSGKTSVLESLRVHFYMENIPPGPKGLKQMLYASELSQGRYAKNKIAKVEFNLPQKIRKILSGKFLIAYYEAKRKIEMKVPSGLEKIDLKDQYRMDDRPGKEFIQFIVSTHSPFILNSINNAVIYDLENNLLVDDLSGYSYDGIVESYFGNDKYSDIIKSKVEKYEQLVDKEKRTEAEEEQMIELKGYLKEIPGSLAPELKAKFQQVELNRVGYLRVTSWLKKRKVLEFNHEKKYFFRFSV